MRTALVAAIACLGCAAAPVARQPAAQPDPGPTPDAVIAAARTGGGIPSKRPRPKPTPRSIAVRDLPRATTVSVGAPDLLFVRAAWRDESGQRVVRVSVRGDPFGTIDIQFSRGAMGTPFGKEGGATIPCDPSSDQGSSEVGWEALGVDTHGAATWTTGTGSFDIARCVARSTKRTVQPVAALIDGVVFGFVRCRAACEREAELVVLLPRAESISTAEAGDFGSDRRVVEHATLRLGAKGASLAAHLTTDTLEEFRAGIAGRVPAPRPESDAEARASRIVVVEALGAADWHDTELLTYTVELDENGAPIPGKSSPK